MTTWNAAFELTPADADEIKYGAGKIRELKTAISEREDLEHNFTAGTQPFHKAGKCSVAYVGTTTQINALTSMPEGSIAWDTTLKVIKIYTSSAWTILDYDHGQLYGKGDDDHTQYFNLTKAGQTITQDLTITALKKIDGRDLSVDGAILDVLNGYAKVAQVVRASTADLVTGTTQIPADDTIPQITEGDEFLTCNITPKNAANTLKVDVVCNLNINTTGTPFLVVALFIDPGPDAVAVSWVEASASRPVVISFSYWQAAGTVSEMIFKGRAGSDGSNAITVNGKSGSRYYGGVVMSSITITEYAA